MNTVTDSEPRYGAIRSAEGEECSSTPLPSVVGGGVCYTEAFVLLGFVEMSISAFFRSIRPFSV